ncbi:hypothetical protein GCK32_014268 [Trichostrongylus colubriformis]|uniref:Flavodoxin-like domain-containing protein n=1 Tax=Trichostrongylus colubriformis TaxID=6319 RepID=A0AAN8IKS3_TRICO
MSSLLVLYGSETGTAEDVAEGIWKEARIVAVVVDQLRSMYVVLVESTRRACCRFRCRNNWSRRNPTEHAFSLAAHVT